MKKLCVSPVSVEKENNLSTLIFTADQKYINVVGNPQKVLQSTSFPSSFKIAPLSTAVTHILLLCQHTYNR